MPHKQASFDFDAPGENPPRPAEAPSNVQEPPQVLMEVLLEDNGIVEMKKSSRGRMKLSDMDAGTDRIDIPDDDILFTKSYYSIGAVSEMFKVNASLIRFWENEFDLLKPKKNAKGDRYFRPEDVKNLRLIYHLLRERKYTIEGAKAFLKNNKKADEKYAMIESLKKLRSFLSELKMNL